MYYLVYGFLYLVSLLPLWVLYVFSDLVYGLVFYVIGYRKPVVMQNLQIAFPEKTEAERRKIAKKFYRNLIDTFIETLKMISVSEKWLSKRVSGNWDLVNAYKKGGRSVQMHLGHTFNWEWCNAEAARNFEIPFLGVYMPMTNQVFDRLFRDLRSRSGTILLRATNMGEDILPYRNKQYTLGLAADQNPGHPASAWWFYFFGKPTPFVKGPAKNAIANNTIVVFVSITKVKRGYYNVQFTHATEEPRQMTEPELTGMFIHYLEDVIRDQPEMWLWSHRRWKWEYKEEYGKIYT